MKSKKEIWFPAKSYGWGWGFPCHWKGWAVFLIYILASSAVVFRFSENDSLWLFIGSTVLLTGMLLFVCWFKGEKPKWRWGKRNNP